MILIIDNREQKLDIKANDKLKVIDDLCKIKKFEQRPYALLLLDVEVDGEGIIKGYNYYFEELLISLDIIAIITTKTSQKLQEICDYYKIPLIKT